MHMKSNDSFVSNYISKSIILLFLEYYIALSLYMRELSGVLCLDAQKSINMRGCGNEGH